MSELIFTFDEQTGKVEVEAHGFVGPSCKEATLAFELALGGEIVEQRPTAEMFQTQAPRAREVQR